MDAVILAAGKGSRLQGIAAPYHKPLLVMQNESLVGRAVKQAFSLGCSRVIVVAAPENALVISQIVDQRAMMIVQRNPSGPGAALFHGLELAHSLDVIVMMGDNFTTDDDIIAFSNRFDHETVIGVRNMPAAEVSRYTYMEHNGTWVEKVPPSDGSNYNAWVGPFKTTVNTLRSALTGVDNVQGEWLIGPAFNALHDVFTVNINTIDVGVPEALPL